MLVSKTTNVLLPKWLLDQQHKIADVIFFTQVRKYLTRYPDYQLVEVVNGFAICTYQVESQTKKRRRKA